ncbi:hypothetical protein D3C78_822080 [compost metagenome]
MLRFVDLQTGNNTIGDPVVVIDEGHRTHDAPHAQGRNQLVPGRAGTIHGHLRQAILMIQTHGELGGKPAAQKKLAHQQTQPANQRQAQPPVVEHHGARHEGRHVATPVDRQRQQQSRKAHRLEDSEQGIVAQIAHDRPIHADADI